MIYNTGETSEQLKAEYNPEGSILRKAQLRMLDMLIYFDEVCKKIGVDYRIDSGNVLGAVRHGGFIPWDDDMDVVVDLKDYKRLCNYMLEHPHSQYVLQCKKTDPEFYNFWNVLRDTKSEYIQDSRIHNIR
ncbi:MAG: LicD family protein, partial [Prevotella sp.]|nr:LicD family protein [Prevotella sp.]